MKHVLTAVIDTYVGAEEGSVDNLPSNDDVRGEFRDAIVHWGENVGDVYFNLVHLSASPADTVVARFQATIADLIDEGVQPDEISDALAALGYGE